MVNRNLLKEFQKRLGRENVFSEEVDRLVYSYDAAVLKPEIPAVVVRPVTSEALSHAVRLCNENGLPLTVRGAGTNLSGGTIPKKGGVVAVTNALICPLGLSGMPVMETFTPPSSPIAATRRNGRESKQPLRPYSTKHWHWVERCLENMALAWPNPALWKKKPAWRPFFTRGVSKPPWILKTSSTR